MLTDERIHGAAWKWSWYRHSLVQSALDFAALAGRVEKASLAQELVELEEAVHEAANGLAEALRSTEVPKVRIHKPLQWFFRRHIESPASVLEHLALARVILWRLHQRMRDALDTNPLPPPFSEQAAQALAGCRQAIDKLSARLERLSAGERTACLERYREIDREVAHEIRPFDEALWQLPGLGCDGFSELVA